jgi:hypothetical protein
MEEKEIACLNIKENTIFVLQTFMDGMLHIVIIWLLIIFMDLIHNGK